MRRSAKWSIYCLAAVLAASSLMACAKSPTVSETGVSGYEESDGRAKAQIGEKITVDAELFTQPDRESYEVLHAGFDDSLDLEAILPILFPGRDDLIISDENVRVPEQTSGMAFGKNNHLIGYWDYVRGYSTFLSVLDIEDVRHLHRETLDDLEGDLKDIKDTELSGYSREQAITDTYERLQKMGIPVQKTPYAMYGISAETIQEYYTRNEDDYKNLPNFSIPDLNEDDSIYCMLWNVEINDTPVVSGNYRYDESERCVARGGAERGSIAYVVTTKNEIVQLETQNQFKIKEEEPEEKLISLEKILAAVPEYYKNRMLNEERTISRISFCYIPILKKANDQTNEYEFDLVPGWTLDASYEMPGRDGVYWDIIYINAITGEVIE